ncbi:MAG: hypothetical protein JRG92_23005 [Deltaproteobacteria bacterium]|nr:hypothetical protein [Deltaproteobacteria bacterium]
MKSSSSWVIAAGLAIAAGLYFVLGSDLSLDWVDEGQVLYFSWRVSEGALPYRDFQNIYGPSVFLVNGGLLASFGADVAVIRALLVVLKSALSVFVYLCAVRMGSRPLAITAWLAAVVILGLPWPYFTTPYANFYGLTMSMAALVLFVSLDSSLARRCLLAGLCFGIAATFKQTNGLFGFLALLLYLTSLRQLEVVEKSSSVESRALPWIRVTRWVGMVSCLAVFGAYLSLDSTLANSLVLVCPIAALIGWMMLREARDPPDAAVAIGVFRAQLWLALGAVLPLAGLVTAYACFGLANELVFNVLLGLPQMLDWFVPLPTPNLLTLLFAVALGAALVAIHLAMAPGAAAGRRGLAPALAVVVAAGATVALLLRITQGASHWVFSAADLFVLIPFALVCSAIMLVFRSHGTANLEPTRTTHRDMLLLFTLHGSVSVLYYHPASDFAHVMMSAPAILPLIVPCLGALTRGRSPWPAVLVVGVLAMPFVFALAAARHIDRIERIPIERASGIRVAGELYRDGALLVKYLSAPANAARPVFVVSGQPLIYFLADREAPVDAYEFAFYLTGLGVLEDADARELVNEREALRTVRRTRPLIVGEGFDTAVTHFAQAYPILWSGIRDATRVTKRIGRFQVRDWGSPDPTTGDRHVESRQ